MLDFEKVVEYTKQAVYIPGPIQLHECSFCSAEVMRRPMKSGRYYCDTICKSAWQRLQKPVTREWLYQKYVIEGVSANDIAILVKRSQKRVWSWLENEGIPTRPRGHDDRLRFKKGQTSAFKGHKHTDETRKALSDLAISTGRVPYDPAVGSYMKGRKGADTPNWKGGVTPERSACYSSREWKDAVKSVWKRSGASCERCEKKHTESDRGKFDIHHIISFADRRFRCDPDNLVLLCDACHIFVHSRENVNKEWLL